MAVITKEEMIALVKNKVGEDTSDETIKFIENFTDTINDYETRLSDKTDWKKKYEDNDKEWRQKYTDRFFKSETKDEPPTPDNTEETVKSYRYEDLFKEEK